jgi:hypothetical protein
LGAHARDDLRCGSLNRPVAHIIDCANDAAPALFAEPKIGLVADLYRRHRCDPALKHENTIAIDLNSISYTVPRAHEVMPLRKAELV